MGRPIKYSKEFKLSAVKLVTELGYSCREAGEAYEDMLKP
jgi:transposase-like protein